MKYSLLCAGLVLCLLLSPGSIFAQSSSTGLYAQAQSLISKHDYKGAIALLDGYLQNHPAEVKYLTLRGDAKDEMGDHIGALIDYDAAIRINPDYEYAYATRAGTEMEMNHYDPAIAD